MPYYVRRKTFLTVGVVLFISLIAWQLFEHKRQRPPQAPEPIAVVENYVRALYGRDFERAYLWISAHDRNSKSRQTYASEQGSFTGFTLRLASHLANLIEILPREESVSGDRARITATVRLPDVDKLAPLVFAWDEEKLNSLGATEQDALLATIDERKRQGNLPFTHAQESFELIKENHAWGVLLNWRHGVRVAVQTNLPHGTPLQVTLVKREFTFLPGEPFTIALKLRNNSDKELRARLVHNVEPKYLDKYLGVGDCGTFVPFRLAAGKEQENSSTFLVWTNLPTDIKYFTMVYEFEVDRLSP